MKHRLGTPLDAPYTFGDMAAAAAGVLEALAPMWERSMRCEPLSFIGWGNPGSADILSGKPQSGLDYILAARSRFGVHPSISHWHQRALLGLGASMRPQRSRPSSSTFRPRTGNHTRISNRLQNLGKFPRPVVASGGVGPSTSGVPELAYRPHLRHYREHWSPPQRAARTIPVDAGVNRERTGNGPGG